MNKDDRRIFHGIVIDNDEIFCSNAHIDSFWTGVSEISNWIKHLPPDSYENKSDYEQALGYVECFEKWDTEFNLENHSICPPPKLLNATLKYAVLYAINNNMPE
jgi:hypothetical protein